MPDTATEIAIATQTLSSAAASITFSSIPSTYTDLRVVLTELAATGGVPTILRYNSDTATNYSYTDLYGSGTAAGSQRVTNSTRIGINDWETPSSTVPSLAIINIFSYAGSTFKTCLINTSTDKNGSGYTENRVGLWRSTSAITTIGIISENSRDFAIGTTATLYGIL